MSKNIKNPKNPDINFKKLNENNNAKILQKINNHLNKSQKEREIYINQTNDDNNMDHSNSQTNFKKNNHLNKSTNQNYNIENRVKENYLDTNSMLNHNQSSINNPQNINHSSNNYDKTTNFNDNDNNNFNRVESRQTNKSSNYFSHNNNLVNNSKKTLNSSTNSVYIDNLYKEKNLFRHKRNFSNHLNNLYSSNIPSYDYKSKEYNHVKKMNEKLNNQIDNNHPNIVNSETNTLINSNNIYNTSKNWNTINYNNTATNLNSINANINNINNNIYFNFDFDEKIDHLLITNAFTKLRNQNKTYEELENLALTLEISNVKYSKKQENMKYEIIRLNQQIIDFDSYIKENEIEIKKLKNKISFLERDQEILLAQNQTNNFKENNYLNKNNNYDNNQMNREKNNIENNIDKKYLEKNFDEFNEEIINKKQKKNSKKNKNLNKSDLEEKSSDNEKSNHSLNEDTDSSLIEGFEDNESLLDSITKRENKRNENKLNEITLDYFNSCRKEEKKNFLNKINNYDSIIKENLKLREDLEILTEEYKNLSSNNENNINIINEKENIINILYQEIQNINIKKINKSEEKFKSDLSEEEKSSKKIKRNLYYSTSPDYNENPSPIDIKTKKFYDKLKNEEKNIKNKHNKNLEKYLNTPSTVNKHFFCRNNSNYTKYLNKDITNIYDNDIKSYNYKEFKKNSEILQEEIYSQKDNISENEKDSENKFFNSKEKNSGFSRENFTFQENEINKQNISNNSDFNKNKNRKNNFENNTSIVSLSNNEDVLNNMDEDFSDENKMEKNKISVINFSSQENGKKKFLKNLEDLKTDLDLFLREYGIKEQFNSIINQNFIGRNKSAIDLQIENKFREIRYITVNLKKINIIFKSLFVEFTKNIANNLQVFNGNVNNKLEILQNKVNHINYNIVNIQI